MQQEVEDRVRLTRDVEDLIAQMKHLKASLEYQAAFQMAIQLENLISTVGSRLPRSVLADAYSTLAETEAMRAELDYKIKGTPKDFTKAHHFLRKARDVS
jgi:hypothetical protein